MTDFTVTFNTDDFDITFSEQGTQGPAGQDADAVPFDLETTYSSGQLVHTENFTLYISLTDNNQGNPLTDTDRWRVVTATETIDQLGELTDVTISTPVNGQILQYNGSMWVNVADHGGNTPSDNSRLNIAVSPSSILEGASDTTVTITLSIGSSQVGETISGQMVTVKDPRGTDVTVTQSDSNNNEFTFTGNGDVVGTYAITASANFTLNNTVTNHTSKASVVVQQPWYVALTTTQPTAVSSMTTQGAWSSPKTHTFTAGGNSGTDVRGAYVALPYASNQSYSFNLGAFAASVTNLATISTDFRLFRIDDFDDTQSGTVIVTITEN